MVIDFRKLNSLIENKAAAYRRVDDIMEVCQDAIYMVLIDARDYYFQRELDPESRDYTTFKCHRGSFRWCRCPQGKRTSSAAAIMPVARELLMSQLESVKNLEKKQDFFGVLATKQFHSPGANAKL